MEDTTEDGRLYTWKRDHFDFPIVNFTWLSHKNIPESPAYGVFVSQLIRYARLCSRYEYLMFRVCILVSKLSSQGYSSWKLQITFRNYMVVKLTLNTNLTLLCYICEGFVHRLRLVYTYFEWIVTGATCGAGNVHSLWNTWFHSL